jgi:hypothetical protein
MLHAAPLAPFLEPGCPWYELHRAFPPNVKWCEAPRCALIVEPANTWSNLAYILVGAAILASGGRGGRIFGPAAILMGAASFIYHASDNFLTQWLDFFGMYLYVLLPLLINLVRLGALVRERAVAAYLIGLCALTALTPLCRMAGLPVQGIIATLVLAILATEWRAGRIAAPARRMFFLALGLLGAAATCSALDVTRTLCDPHHPFLQGHAIWHVLSALSVYATWRFYRQFDRVLPA